MTTLPSVDVLIPTYRRPELLRLAIDAVRAQQYDGPLSVTVVFDRDEPDQSFVEHDGVPVRVIANVRTPGLSGARNTAILASTAELVAFCDDDDQWLPGKLSRQVAALLAEPGAEFASTSIRVDYQGESSVRLAGTDRVGYQQLLASRMSMLHSSTFLMRRSAVLDGIGLISEDIPGSQKEDWDILLRASRRRPIVHVDEPLVAIRWGGSLFSTAWDTKISSANWMLDNHPDIAGNQVGYARLLGQIAFSHAALKQRGTAVKVAAKAARVRWKEPRGYLALAVASGAVSAATVQSVLHKRGKGI